MAVTKIWAIKDGIWRILDYAKNPKKAVSSDLKAALHYAGSEGKTVVGEEKTMFVTGANCSADTAVSEMVAVQEHFDKITGNVAYHAYQSFKPGGVTPELCHRLGMELAQKMWGDRYLVLVATRFNTGTYHNHLVINAVGLWDGKKFDCSKRAYYRLRQISDEICAEHGFVRHQKSPRQDTSQALFRGEKQRAYPLRSNAGSHRQSTHHEHQRRHALLCHEEAGPCG